MGYSLGASISFSTLYRASSCNKGPGSYAMLQSWQVLGERYLDPADASIMDVPHIQSGTLDSGRPKGTSEGEKIQNRGERCESEPATVEERPREIGSYLGDRPRRMEVCAENDHPYYEKAENNCPASQNPHLCSQRCLDRLEQLACQATNQQIQLTHMYKERERETGMKHVV